MKIILHINHSLKVVKRLDTQSVLYLRGYESVDKPKATLWVFNWRLI
jgi:hypothetical protein